MEYKLKEYGLDQFASKSKNLLFVTGMPGSGKSTLSKKLAEKYSATYIELDWFFHLTVVLQRINEPGDDEDETKREGLQFLKLFFLRYNYVKICDYDPNRITALPAYTSSGLGDMIKQLIAFCIKQRPKRFVIEGIHLYTFTGLVDIVKDWPVIVMIQDENESYESAKKRTHQYKKKYVKGIRGFFLFPWEKEFSKAYYSRISQIYSKFVATIDDYKGEKNMEGRQLNAAALESLRIPDSEHLGYVGIDPATELFGMKPQPQQYKVAGLHGGADSVDKMAVNQLQTYDRTMAIPSKKWPDIFLDSWNETTDAFNKKGLAFVKEYIKRLTALKKFTDETKDEFLETVKTNNLENLHDLARRANPLRQPMITYNQTHQTILSGIQQPIRSDLKTALKPILVAYQKDYEEVGRQEARILDSVANQGSTGFLKAAKAKSTGSTSGSMYRDLRFFYSDLWEIMSIYHK